MNKLEQLKAAHAAGTQGEWQYKYHQVNAGRKEIAVLISYHSTGHADGKAIALAHNMMDDLLEAVAALKYLTNEAQANGMVSSEPAILRALDVLAKLKAES